MKLIFEKSKPGNSACNFTLKKDIKLIDIPIHLLRQNLRLPELTEGEIIRHYTELSRRNLGVDNAFYPLGSCTMKYNPKISEQLANLPNFTKVHPLLNEKFVQGCLKLMYRLQAALAVITGLDAVSLAPAAGAQGELCGLMLAKAYFKAKGEKRTKIIIPDSSHGTNPASASVVGFEVISLKSNSEGCVDINQLAQHLNQELAVFMFTNPNTLGIFEKNVKKISELVHSVGALMYADGANANALLGKTNFAVMGFDLLHLNLHKTFATPHGGGGPGAGPIAVKKYLANFLPSPIISKDKKGYYFHNPPQSIGKIRTFAGNFSVLIKAYAYIYALGREGLEQATNLAVLNANYLKQKLQAYYKTPYNANCMHEFVLDDSNFPTNINCQDIAKRLLDYGFHPPTISFPLIVKGALMIEPTETESKETLDSFVEALLKIKQEALENPELLKKAPHTTPVKRLDEVLAARQPDLTYPWKQD